MMDVYETCPTFVAQGYTLRQVRKEDAPGLLKVYSDKQAQSYFNSDNCTSDFRYATLREMEQCISMWLWSYRQRHFVRWTILDNRNRPIGTVEMFRRNDGRDGKGEGILRIDLMSMFEFTDVIDHILQAILPAMHELFHCERILTKALRYMEQRKVALVFHGFVQSEEPLIGDNGVEYPGYWGHRHKLS